MPKNQPFYAWIDDGDTPTLVIDGVIDTGSDWYSDAVTPKAFRAALDEHDGQDIIVSINSPGGDVFAGFEIYNMLAARKGGTTVRVMGLAASAASYIAMAADPGKLQMCRASMMMIHNPWSWAYGNAEEMRKQAEVLDAIGSIMVDIYMQRATCAEEEMRAMLDAERYLSPTEALNAGLCDEVIDPAEEDDDEETQAMAALRDRYVAMSVEDVRRVRSALHIAPRKTAAKPTELTPAGNEDKNDYLAMADALIADM